MGKGLMFFDSLIDSFHSASSRLMFDRVFGAFMMY